MKLLLIKIGKVWAAIRRDGILKAGRRIGAAVVASLQPVGQGDILFISGGVGDSARYRCTHVAEELSLNGFRCRVTVQDNPHLSANVASQFSVFIFHRTLYTPQLAKMIAAIKAAGKTIIFETDDLVYDPAFLQYMDFYKKMNAMERKLYENGVGGEILRDPSVQVATTTTSFLAGKLAEEGKQVFIVPNKLSQADVALAEKARASVKRDLGSISIGYFSGTLSHNADFATITQPLLQLLQKYPQVRLALFGPLDIDPAFDAFADRIDRTAFIVDKQAYFAAIAGCDIVMAPLEVGNPFCESKSELKFFEAGIVGVPTVAAATQTFREAIKHGVDSFVATTEEEWAIALEQLVQDRELRENMGKVAQKKVYKKYTTEYANHEEYYAFLREKIEGV